MDEQIRNAAPPVSESDKAILKPWITRRDDAREDRKPYELQWMKNQMFAAGIQWLKYSPRDHRVLQQIKDDSGRILDTADRLREYLDTGIGKLTAGDLRPEQLASWDSDEAAEQYAEQLNDGVDFAWNEEVKADRKLLGLARILVELGTGAIRCRYDRTKGKLVAAQVPHDNGQPLLNDDARFSHMAELYATPGSKADLRPVREGQIVWELLSAWNLLPPPGVEDPADFPWELIVRPVSLPELKTMYGDKAAGVTADEVEEMGMLAYASAPRSDLEGSGTKQRKLKDHALIYTGYLRPNSDFPNGQSVVFSNNGRLLDHDEKLPYNLEPWGARSGITYFRWDVLTGRFLGRALIERGIGTQQIINKRMSQNDETIDRSQSRTYYEEGSIAKLPRSVPGEYVKIRQGAKIPVSVTGAGPGAWMPQEVEMLDTSLDKAMGFHGVSRGENPPNVGNYSQLALLGENDRVKFDGIGNEFSLGVSDVTRDTIEAMKQWPSTKQLMLAGDEGHLRVAEFNAKEAIPPAFLVRPAARGSLPQGVGAELQKVTDLWNAAVQCGAIAQKPAEWLEWYKESLDAGQAQDLPTAGDPMMQQRHKAALENIVMIRTGQPVPVAPYDDAAAHVPEHRNEQMQLQQAAGLGDQQAAVGVQAIEQHIQFHLQQAQANAAQNAPQGPPQGPPPQGPPGPPA